MYPIFHPQSRRSHLIHPTIVRLVTGSKLSVILTTHALLSAFPPGYGTHTMILPAMHLSLLRREIFFSFLIGISLSATIGGQSFAAEPQRAGAWIHDPMQWSREDKGDAFRAGGREAPFAVLQATPISKRVSVESDVVLTKSVGDSWKVCGVAIMQDTANFWHFALVASARFAEARVHVRIVRDAQW